MRKVLITLFSVFAALAVLVVTPSFSFAQTVTPTQDQSQAGTIAQDSSNSQTDTSTQTTLLTPNQQDYNNLPNPGLLPDSPFYFLKRWGENIQTFFTIDDYQRAQLQLHFAQLRLAEAKAELQKNNTNLTDQMLADYNKDIQSVSAATEKLAQEGKETTGLISTIQKREETRLALLNNQLAKTTDPAERKKIQNAINFTTRQSQTNINRLVHAVTHTPNYHPSANITVSGQITSISSPDFTVQTPNNKTFTFTTDSSTIFKQYGSTASALFTNLTIGTYVHVVYPRPAAALSGTPAPSTTPAPTPSTTNPLAKEVLMGVPQSLIAPLVGTIANFSPNSFTLNTTTGAIYTIQVNMHTVYHSNRDDVTARAIGDGTMVRVYAVPQTTANTYLAKTIDAILPKKLSRTGTITGIQGSTITLSARNSMTYTFTLTSNTLVDKNGKADSSADLATNELVTVWYYGNGTNTIGRATEVNIHTSRNAHATVSPSTTTAPAQAHAPTGSQ